MAKRYTPKDPYQVITDRILAALESGANPWRKPWVGGGAEPMNLVSGRTYRGFMNRIMLGLSGYENPFWVSYKQAKDLGGFVRLGERGTPVTFWNWTDVEEQDGGLKRIPFLRHYSIFNAAQCDGLEDKLPEAAMPQRFEHDPIAEAEAIIAAMPNRPVINHGKGEASYSPGLDRVQMPSAERFPHRPDYYSTLFHELAHATGHQSRLGRDLSGRFGNHAYSKEELVAEMTAAYLCGQAGIVDATLDNSAAYIDNWAKALRNDRRMVVLAACQAQKAADYILASQAPAEALDEAA